MTHTNGWVVSAAEANVRAGASRQSNLQNYTVSRYHRRQDNNIQVLLDRIYVFRPTAQVVHATTRRNLSLVPTS